jgi:hypothetical protein
MVPPDREIPKMGYFMDLARRASFAGLDLDLPNSLGYGMLSLDRDSGQVSGDTRRRQSDAAQVDHRGGSPGRADRIVRLLLVV